MKKFICFDIGGTSIKYGILNEGGQILYKNSMASEARSVGGIGIIEKLIDKIDYYQNSYKLSGVAISSHGMIDSKNGIILHADEHLIPGYSGLKVKKIIEEKTSIPCEIENDVNSAGLGELWIGSKASSDLVSMIAIGTGIGACLMENGKLITGHTMCAGEIGKITIPGGRFEDVASTYAMTSSLEKKLGKDPETITGKMVFEEIEKGNEIAIKAVDDMIESLAIGISTLCFIFNPGVVILGGGIMAQESYFKPRLDKRIKHYLPDVIYNGTQIRFAKLKNNAGMVGALKNFKNIHNL
ncbi:MAG: ROK family protein [Peptostreptococcus sp.]